MGKQTSGEGGIRTRGPLSRTQHFQCCTIGHSATSPDHFSVVFSNLSQIGPTALTGWTAKDDNRSVVRPVVSDNTWL